MTGLTRAVAVAAAGLATLAEAPRAEAVEAAKVRFTLDWLVEGPAAPFLAAQPELAAEGLDATIDPGNGSAGAVERVASGAYDMGFADLSAVVDFDARNPGRAVKAVYVVYNHPPYAIISLKRNGIVKPSDLAGKRVGAPGFDAARKAWPSFAQHAGLPKDGVTWVTMEPAQREAMLRKGEVDAISGFSFTSVLNLLSAGERLSDVVVFHYAEAGVSLYGNAIIVSPQFAAKHPERVKAFLRAYNKALQAVIANPRASIAAVKARAPGVNEALEAQRLQIALDQSVLTPEVRADGLGGVREARLASAIGEVVSSLGSPATPKPADVFDARFLPPAPERKVTR